MLNFLKSIIFLAIGFMVVNFNVHAQVIQNYSCQQYMQDKLIANQRVVIANMWLEGYVMGKLAITNQAEVLANAETFAKISQLFGNYCQNNMMATVLQALATVFKENDITSFKETEVKKCASCEPCECNSRNEKDTPSKTITSKPLIPTSSIPKMATDPIGSCVSDCFLAKSRCQTACRMSSWEETNATCLNACESNYNLCNTRCN